MADEHFLVHRALERQAPAKAGPRLSGADAPRARPQRLPHALHHGNADLVAIASAPKARLAQRADAALPAASLPLVLMC